MNSVRTSGILLNYKVREKVTSIVYQRAQVETDGREVTRQHSEKIKTVSKPVYISAQCLLSITIGNFCFKKRDLIKTHISSFPNLYVLMVCYIAFT